MYDFGYDIADFYAIQDEYGTMEDFDRLIAKANELGTNSKTFCPFKSLIGESRALIIIISD